VRRPFIAGNWKMHLTKAESIDLAKALVDLAPSGASADVAVSPPFVYLDAVAAVVHGTSIGLAAQNLSEKPNGALTGEISAAMLRDLGCRYVIVGHSERRQFLGEIDSLVFEKANAALDAGMTPIVCVGETLEQRRAERTAEVIASQFGGSLAGMDADRIERVVIAYEPVWAIGTGVVATPQQAQDVHADLRKLLTSRYNAAIAGTVRIQYGGSVKPDNAVELLNQTDIDGALVGGASLNADSFWRIVTAAPKGHD